MFPKIVHFDMISRMFYNNYSKVHQNLNIGLESCASYNSDDFDNHLTTELLNFLKFLVESLSKQDIDNLNFFT